MKLQDFQPDIASLDTSCTENFLTMWRRYAEKIDGDLPQACLDDVSSYDFEKTVLPIVRQTLNEPRRMKHTFSIIRDAYRGLNDKLSFLNVPPDLVLIAYLGLCNGAGWVLRLNNRPRILLGVEKIMELNWDTTETIRHLMTHEIAHVALFTARNSWEETAFSTPLQRAFTLFSEGFAETIAYEQFSGTHPRGHAWQHGCEANTAHIKAAYLHCLNANTSAQMFFGDWTDFMGQSDTGYYLGRRFVQALKQNMKMEEIMRLSGDRILSELRMFLSTKDGAE